MAVCFRLLLLLGCAPSPDLYAQPITTAGQPVQQKFIVQVMTGGAPKTIVYKGPPVTLGY